MLPFDEPARLVMPAPISTNALFRNLTPGDKPRGGKLRGRIMTPAYRTWKKHAAGMLAAQAPLPRFSCPVEITLYVGEIRVGNMDSDNVAKAYIDALVEHKVIPDDSRKWVRRSAPEWVPGMGSCVAVIEPAEAPARAADIVALVPKGLRELLR